MLKTVTLVGLLAAIVVSVASAGPPPPPPAFAVGVSHQRPVAGRWFTGVTVGYKATRIPKVECQGWIGNKNLTARAQKFYSGQALGGVATVACRWLIPKNASGKTFDAEAVLNGGYSQGPDGTWKVRGR
jgi:hypothetical protein